MDDEPKGRAKGGAARAAKLSKEERSAIARKGGLARQANKSDGPKPPHAVYKGVLKLIDLEIPCFVLDDGRRVISGRGMTAAIGMKGRGQGIARIQVLKALKSLENNDLPVAIGSPS